VRSIDYTIARRISSASRIEVRPADFEKLNKVLAQLEPQKPQESVATAPGTPPPSSGAGASAAAPASAPASAARQNQALLDAAKATVEKMSATFERPNAPAVSGTVIRSDSRSVTLRQAFPQPIVIGYQGLTFIAAEFASRSCQARPQVRAKTSRDPEKPVGPVAPLPKIHFVSFDWDSAVISLQSEATVREVADAYKAGGWVRVRMTGYTDLTGPEGYNLGLSQRRANAVRDALVSLGVRREDMIVAGQGQSNPRVRTAPEVREPQNRRVDITQ
jgi:outer membrane protein OmpA-like peptidoglycan-associated protein